MLTFFIVLFANTVTCCLYIMFLIAIVVLYVNSARFKHSDYSYHSLELNYRRLNDDNIESNPRLTQNVKSCKRPGGHPN